MDMPWPVNFVNNKIYYCGHDQSMIPKEEMKKATYKLYNWMVEKAGSRYASWYLFAISFTESSFSPFPPDPLMVPMILANKDRAWWLAFLTSAASVLGGVLGYAIGYYLFEKYGLPILNFYGLTEQFSSFQKSFCEWGFWAIVIKAFTPIPFKLVTIACGVLKFDFTMFMIATTISRSLRFYIEAIVLWKYGPQMQKALEKHLLLIGGAFLLLLAGGVVAVKYW
jgi:membrane protein YqaA with SNARE-associated domain